MKATPISKYLNQMGRAEPSGDESPRREVAAFRPRTLSASPDAAARVSPLFRKASGGAAIAALARQIEDRPDSHLARFNSPELRARATAPSLPDINSRIAEAYRKGLQDGADAAAADAAQARVLERMERQKQSAVERLDFQINEYAGLADKISDGLVEIENRIAAAMADILKPFLSAAIARQAVEALAEQVAKLRDNAPSALIRIRGPERLLNALRQRVAGLPVEIEYSVEDSFDVVVEAQHTMITTRLGPWADLLASFCEAE